ncbi:MAG TPA: methyl-accepting chemotaxis protein, partial [Pseudolabrys sp.]|nr:methyl-accepting chemotaxis protein [Pseudolabrys sp.]
RELEATRAELRRGILELPQETAESAAQMRRVVVDQIEALAELNRIVARHGRNLDTVDPTRRVKRDDTPLAIGGGRSDFATSRAAPRDVSSFAPPSTRRPDAAPFNPAQQGGNNRSGWLTDLLNRASREENDGGGEPARESSRPNEERTPRHSIESLDSLSVDIARMIDHEAAADLWDRYKRGERNVFTRRLYTLQGQAAFDEIRRKYRADREFKQTVDRYIAEFERLLEEVSRDDRGQVVARTYLTSETGKVYTMLAHAAGRLD